MSDSKPRTDTKPTCPSTEGGSRREFLGTAVAAVATALTGCGTLS